MHHCSCAPDIVQECLCNRPSISVPLQECDEIQIQRSCCEECRPTAATAMCFCSNKNHVLSTTCQCPSIRHALFSVSRVVREDAIAIYYPLNRFLVTPYGSPTMREIRLEQDVPGLSWPPEGISALPRIELSLYISSLARNAMQHIRWLEWLLPTSGVDYLLPNTPAWFDYLDTLDMMRNAMNIQNLTFILNMGAQGHRHWWHEYSGALVSPSNWQWYEQIALALRRLGPLKDCFIYLSRCTQDVKRRDHCEKSLEKEIMGSKYDSERRGKPKERITAIFEHHQFPLY
jgi:hypothetical protein